METFASILVSKACVCLEKRIHYFAVFKYFMVMVITIKDMK